MSVRIFNEMIGKTAVDISAVVQELLLGDLHLLLNRYLDIYSMHYFPLEYSQFMEYRIRSTVSRIVALSIKGRSNEQTVH